MPPAELEKICQFIGLSFSSAMLHYHEGKVITRPGKTAKSAWLPPTKGLRDWRTQMSHRDLQLFEALAGDLLEKLGYQRGVDTIPTEIQELAKKCEKDWIEERSSRRLGTRSQLKYQSLEVPLTR